MAARRSFPGPAGSLPRIATGPPLTLYNQDVLEEPIVPPQRRGKKTDVDESELWRFMLAKQGYPEDTFNPFYTYNTSFIKNIFSKISSVQRLPLVPQLVAVIKNIQHGEEEPRVILEDCHGRAEAIVRKTVYEAQKKLLVPGTILQLVNFTVVQVRSKSFFWIKEDNLECVYYYEKKNGITEMRHKGRQDLAHVDGKDHDDSAVELGGSEELGGIDPDDLFNEVF
jgi:Homologous recombination OB-fold protein